MSEYDLNKQADIITDRVDGIVNDLKTFVDIRKDNRQHHQNSYNDDVGGGNMSMAITLFATLGFLGKVYVSVKSNEEDRFDEYFNEKQRGKEEKIFVELIAFLNQEISLFSLESPSNRQIKQVWEYYRDFTTHLLVPDDGHKVETCVWEEPQSRSVEAVLLEIKHDDNVHCFEKLEDNNWVINVDKILALMPDISKKTTNYLKKHDPVCSKNCTNVLESVMWR